MRSKEFELMPEIIKKFDAQRVYESFMVKAYQHPHYGFSEGQGGQLSVFGQVPIQHRSNILSPYVNFPEKKLNKNKYKKEKIILDERKSLCKV